MHGMSFDGPVPVVGLYNLHAVGGKTISLLYSVLRLRRSLLVHVQSSDVVIHFGAPVQCSQSRLFVLSSSGHLPQGSPVV